MTGFTTLFSLVPIPVLQNVFSEVLLDEGVNFYELFVPDQMHEVEIGGWKFCALPTFGLSTIQKFKTDMSAQKKFAAHDYEDTIQCVFPCFEGLLPEPANAVVLDNLFDFTT
ncbi:hypothetical protein F5146DRAFT_1002859 [Armillaria mellea]|nr:hypothetical protein F5146DRAFT_1002859 [Armillaria mellea]